MRALSRGGDDAEKGLFNNCCCCIAKRSCDADSRRVPGLAATDEGEQGEEEQEEEQEQEDKEMREGLTCFSTR
jgi:hypothetical protein